MYSSIVIMKSYVKII